MKTYFRFLCNHKLFSHKEIGAQPDGTQEIKYSHIVIAPFKGNTSHLMHCLVENGIAKIETPLFRQLHQFANTEVDSLNEAKLAQMKRLISCIQFNFSGTLRILGNIFSKEFTPCYLNSLILIEIKKQNPSINIVICFGSEELFLFQTLRNHLGAKLYSHQSSSLKKGFEKINQFNNDLPEHLINFYFSDQFCKWVPFDIEITKNGYEVLLFGSKLFGKETLDALCDLYRIDDGTLQMHSAIFNESVLALQKKFQSFSRNQTEFFKFLDRITKEIQNWIVGKRNNETTPFWNLFTNCTPSEIVSNDYIHHYVGSIECTQRLYTSNIHGLASEMAGEGFTGLSIFQYNPERLLNQTGNTNYSPKPTQYYYDGPFLLQCTPAKLTERLRLSQLPEVKTEEEKAKVYAIGDLHGNALKLLQFFISKKVIHCPEQAYKVIRDYYFKAPQIWTKTNIDELKRAIAQIALKDNAARCILIGDILCDRSRNDYLTLLIFSHVISLTKTSSTSFQIQFPLSNHDFEFFLRFCKTFQAELFAIEDKNLTPSEIKIKLLEALKKQWYIKDDYTASFKSIITLFERDIIKLEDITVLFMNYLSCFNLIPFSILDENTLVLYTHAPIDEEILISLGDRFDLPFPDRQSLTMTSMTTWLHTLNQTLKIHEKPHHFASFTETLRKEIETYKGTSRKSEQGYSIIPKKASLLFLTDNRIPHPDPFPSFDKKGIKIFNVHGHVGSELNNGLYDSHHCNIDNEYAKSRSTEKEIDPELPLILTMRENREKLLGIFKSHSAIPRYFAAERKRNPTESDKAGMSKRVHAS